MKMTRNWAAALVAAATALTGASALGQVVSETCAALDTSPANSIVVGTPVTGNFTGADHDGPTYTTCGTSTTAPNQWWLFVPPTTATYTISMCDSAQGDTILGIQPASDACTVGTSLACNDDACGLGSQIALSLTGGTAYRIRAAAFSTSLTNGGGYTILITQQGASAPAGDDCATPITAANGNNPGTLVGATGSVASGGNSCGGTVDTNDVYFSYMATVSGPHKFSVCTGDFDAVLSVHTACPVDGTTTNQIASACATSASPTVLQCGNRGAFLSVSLTSGTTYLVRVAGASDQSTGSSVGAPFVGFGAFNLVIAQPPPAPANDTCATAVDLTSALPYSASITNEGALDDLDPGTCNTGTSAWGGVWFTYTASANGALTFTETGGQDVAWGAWNSATCDPAGAALLCTATDADQSILVVSGQTYKIQCSATSNTTSRVTPLAVAFDFVTPPANDTCATAVDLTMALPYSATIANAAAGDDLDPGTCNTGTSAWGGVWFTYTASANGALTFTETGGQDVAWGAWNSATCDPVGAALLCTATDTAQSIIVVSGQTYKIQCSATSNTTSRAASLAVAFDFVAAPANDTCATAVDLTSALPYSATIANVGAGDDLDPGACNTGTSAWGGVWFTYTAGANGVLTFTETGGQDVAWGAWNSATCDPAGAALLCTGTDTGQSIAVASGQTYKILCSATSNTTSRATSLAVAFDFIAAPANDTCGTAEVIMSLPASVSASGVAANDDTFDITCNSGTTFRKTVWYTVTPADSGSLAITQTSTNDTAVAVFTGGCGALTQVACSDPNAFVMSVTGGTQYWIGVGMWSTTTNPTVAYGLTLELISAPDNDACDTPTDLGVGTSGSVTPDGRAAFPDPDVTCNSGTATSAIAGVWYTWTAPAVDNGTIKISETSSNDVVLFAATGTCGAFTDVFCSDAETNITAPITPGTTYYFMVAMFSATASPTVPYALTYTYTPATGQCCVGSSCTITTHSNCNTMSGMYGGDNVSCNPPAGMPTNFGPGPSYTITDNATGTSAITVGGTPFPLGAVSVSVDITHTFQSDIILTLTNGTVTASLHKGDGGLVNNLGGTYVFTDTATQTWDSAAAGLLTGDVLAPGNYKAADTGNVAVSLNDAFYGQTSVGTWTLSIGDDATLDTGVMSAWTLILDGQGASPCSVPCPGNHDGNGQVDADDLFAFLDDWFAQNGVCMSGCTANYIAPDAVDADDLFAYLDIWFANNGNICP